MSRLNKEYPVWDKLKMYMKEDPDITEDQIKSYMRKVKRNPFIRCHLELLQIQQNSLDRSAEAIFQLRSELRRIESCKLTQVIRENQELKSEIKVMKQDIQMLKDKLNEVCCAKD